MTDKVAGPDGSELSEGLGVFDRSEEPMSDFYNPQELRTARKAHQCTYCAEEIDAGTEYVHQTGVYDGRWYTNKLHPECFEDMCDGDGEFTPYSNERPKADA